MMYYAPDNPNHALIPRTRKHPLLQGIRIVFVVLVSVLLVCALTVTFCIAAVRTVVTPEYVYRYADSIDYTEFPLPSDGSFQTISGLMQDAFRAGGFDLTDEDIDILFEQFSIPTILAGIAQDTTSWLLADGSRPVLDPDEIASIALSGVDESIMAILYFIGDPAAILGDILVNPLATLDMDGLLDRLEPVRKLLSADTYAWLVSVCLMLGTLLFCLSCFSFVRFTLPAGICSLVCALLSGTAALAFPTVVPRLTEVYQSYILTFLQPIQIFLWRTALCCMVLGVLLVLIRILQALLLRGERYAKKEGPGAEF